MFEWSLTGKARGTSLTYPPTPLGAEALRGAGAKASEGYPPAAESTEASMPWPMNASRTLTHSSTGLTRAWSLDICLGQA